MEKSANANFYLEARGDSIGIQGRKGPGLFYFLCTNAKDDCMMKPMMLHRFLNPRALKGKNKHTLPLFWRANRKVWMTAAIFMDWFHKCFVPQVEKYLAERNLAFKVLILVDNTPGHPRNLKVTHPNGEVTFLLPNTTSPIQPLDQGVISTFKTYYTHCTFRRNLDVTDSDPELNVGQC